MAPGEGQTPEIVFRPKMQKYESKHEETAEKHQGRELLKSNRPAFFPNAKVTKYKGRLTNRSALKTTKEARQPNAMRNPRIACEL